MTPNNNILQELKELQSSLAGLAIQNTYSVPDGYFEGLAGQVLNRIKAMEANNAADELNLLSPSLGNISKQLPYSVPVGYFDGLEDRMMQVVRESSDYQTSAEELESISPLLSGLKKQMPYHVPQGYFENLATDINTESTKPETKIVSLRSRKWFRYAAAAVVAGIIAMAGFTFLGKDKVDAATNSHAWVEKNVKKVPTEKIEEFIQLTDEEKTAKESIASIDNSKVQDVKELIKDVSEKEIQSLLNDTELLDDDADTGTESLMN